MDFFAGFGAGDPVNLAGSSLGWRRCDAAIGGDGCFERDQGAAGLDPMGEGVVEFAGFEFADAEGDFDAGGAEAADTGTRNLGIGIDSGGDDAVNAGIDEGVGAGAGAAMVATRLEGDVGSGAAGLGACLEEGDDFGVVEVVVEVGAFADDGVVADEDAAYLGVGRGQAGGWRGRARARGACRFGRPEVVWSACWI